MPICDVAIEAALSLTDGPAGMRRLTVRVEGDDEREAEELAKAKLDALPDIEFCDMTCVETERKE